MAKKKDVPPVEQIDAGSVVAIEGGPRMTVERVSDGSAECAWFVGNELHRDVFLVADLHIDHRAPDDEQPDALSNAEEAGTLPETDRREEPVARDLSQAHQRVVNADNTISYFTESGDLL